MKKILYKLTVGILTSSCSDYLKEYTQDRSTVKTTGDLDELLSGSAYNRMGRFTTPSTYQRVNQNYILLHFMSDELDENSGEYYDPDVMGVRDEMFGYFAWQKHISLNTKGISINRENEYWDLSYNKIAACNMIIKETENLNVSKDRDVLDLRRIKGEAHFLRAEYYYMLVNLYGKPYVKSTAAQEPGVPIKTTEYIEDIDFTRNSVEEVYQQINSDLDMAEEYLSHMETPKSFFRASLNTVYLFRSRIYLFMQNWSEAKRYAELSLSINRKLLDLRTLSNKDYPIDTSSPETIFSMGGSIFGNFIFGDIVGYDGPAFMVSDYLYNLFEDDELRNTVYVTHIVDINTFKQQ